MKTIYAIDIPDCTQSFAQAIQQGFLKAGFPVQVTTDISTLGQHVAIQHLLPAIEPADPKQSLYICIKSPSPGILEKTLMDEQFVLELVGNIKASDLFALECLVTSCIGHEVTIAYLKQIRAPQKVMLSATQVAKRSSWIESLLGTPSATELLTGFADELIARGIR